MKLKMYLLHYIFAVTFGSCSATQSKMSRILSKGRDVGQLLSLEEIQDKTCLNLFEDQSLCKFFFYQTGIYTYQMTDFFGKFVTINGTTTYVNGYPSRVNSLLHKVGFKKLALRFAQNGCDPSSVLDFKPNIGPTLTSLCHSQVAERSDLEMLWDTLMGFEAPESEKRWFVDTFSNHDHEINSPTYPKQERVKDLLYSVFMNPNFIFIQ